MESRARASSEQFAALIEFMETHGDIGRPQQGPRDRIRADRLWRELGQKLNSIGGRVLRPTEKWRKVWADWKTKTKKKVSLKKRDTRGTGGGPSSMQALSALERRVLAVMGLAAAIGKEERGFDAPSSERLIEPHIAESNSQIIFEVIHTSSAADAQEDSVASDSVARSHSREQHTPPVEGPTRTPSPAATVSKPRRRRFLRARRPLTSFEEATAKFIAVEQQRLQLEETREKYFHERKMQKLLLESRRIEMEENRNNVFRNIADSINNLPHKIYQLFRPTSQVNNILSPDP